VLRAVHQPVGVFCTYVVRLLLVYVVCRSRVHAALFLSVVNNNLCTQLGYMYVHAEWSITMARMQDASLFVAAFWLHD
jgi:hypothetical protein